MAFRKATRARGRQKQTRMWPKCYRHMVNHYKTQLLCGIETIVLILEKLNSYIEVLCSILTNFLFNSIKSKVSWNSTVGMPTLVGGKRLDSVTWISRILRSWDIERREWMKEDNERTDNYGNNIKIITLKYAWFSLRYIYSLCIVLCLHICLYARRKHQISL